MELMFYLLISKSKYRLRKTKTLFSLLGSNQEIFSEPDFSYMYVLNEYLECWCTIKFN